MPEQSGEVLLYTVKERYPDTAVVMVTAIDQRGTAIDFLWRGAYGYVIKPFNKTDIMLNVASALERREAMPFAGDYQERLEKDSREGRGNRPAAGVGC